MMQLLDFIFQHHSKIVQRRYPTRPRGQRGPQQPVRPTPLYDPEPGRGQDTRDCSQFAPVAPRFTHENAGEQFHDDVLLRRIRLSDQWGGSTSKLDICVFKLSIGPTTAKGIVISGT